VENEPAGTPRIHAEPAADYHGPRADLPKPRRKRVHHRIAGRWRQKHRPKGLDGAAVAPAQFCYRPKPAVQGARRGVGGDATEGAPDDQRLTLRNGKDRLDSRSTTGAGTQERGERGEEGSRHRIDRRKPRTRHTVDAGEIASDEKKFLAVNDDGLCHQNDTVDVDDEALVHHAVPPNPGDPGTRHVVHRGEITGNDQIPGLGEILFQLREGGAGDIGQEIAPPQGDRHQRKHQGSESEPEV
jgi:hypothetical protein